MPVKITDINISCDACLDECPVEAIVANDMSNLTYEDIKTKAPILHFESIEDLIEYVKSNGGVYIGSNSLGVGTNDSDYDFIVDEEIGTAFINDYSSKGYEVDSFTDCYGTDSEVWGHGFEENFKVYYYGDDGTLYTINLFMFSDDNTIDKYNKLQKVLLGLDKELIKDKVTRVKYFAHLQEVLDIGCLDVPYDHLVMAECSALVVNLNG